MTFRMPPLYLVVLALLAPVCEARQPGGPATKIDKDPIGRAFDQMERSREVRTTVPNEIVQDSNDPLGGIALHRQRQQEMRRQEAARERAAAAWSAKVEGFASQAKALCGSAADQDCSVDTCGSEQEEKICVNTRETYNSLLRLHSTYCAEYDQNPKHAAWRSCVSEAATRCQQTKEATRQCVARESVRLAQVDRAGHQKAKGDAFQLEAISSPGKKTVRASDSTTDYKTWLETCGGMCTREQYAASIAAEEKRRKKATGPCAKGEGCTTSR